MRVERHEREWREFDEARRGPHRTMPRDKAPLVWFSTHPIWEPASGRPIVGNTLRPQSFNQLSASRGGLARLLVDASAAPLQWEQIEPLLDPVFGVPVAGEQ